MWLCASVNVWYSMCLQLSFWDKSFLSLQCTLTPINGRKHTHSHQAENKTKCPCFSSACQEPLHKPHCISAITSRFTHLCCTQNTCCWHILRLTLTKTLSCVWIWLHQILSSDAPSSFLFNYLLVLFIAELLSTAALHLHWWSARASERVPTAPWLTLLLLLLLLVLCVLYMFMCSGQWERTQNGELLEVRAAHLSVID